MNTIVLHPIRLFKAIYNILILLRQFSFIDFQNSEDNYDSFCNEVK
ncbi:hypothetical protein [Staphylococcus cohnii]|nr:hypothetical protein [Staphylococcus cohnii]